MKKTLRLLFCFSMAICLSFGLAACGGTGNPSGTPSSGASATEGPTEEPTEEPVYEIPARPSVTEEDTEHLLFTKIEGKDEYSVAFDRDNARHKIYYTLVIPTEYEGLPVTEIADDGFWGTEIHIVYLPEKLKVIGKRAFKYSNSMSAVVLPDTLEEIGEEAFFMAGSGELKRADLPASLKRIGNEAFWGTGLKKAEFPASLKEIGDAAFNDLKEVFIPKSVEKIGKGNFSESVKKITVEDGNPAYESVDNCLIEKTTSTLLCCVDVSKIPAGGRVKILERGFMKSQKEDFTELVIPDGVEIIREGAFSSFSQLTSVTLSDSVRVVEDGAFSGESVKLQKVYLGKNLEKTDSNLVTFLPSQDCLTLSEENVYFKKDAHSLIYLEGKELLTGDGQTVIPADGSVTKIGVNAFRGSDLQSIVIPAGVTEIKERAFLCCQNLQTAEFPAGLEIIGDYAFAGCSSLTRIALSGVTQIGMSAFEACESLKEAVLPDTLDNIGNGAFSACSSLEKIELPAALTEIEANLLSDCTKLQKIVLPAGVTEIKNYAFSNCTALREVVFSEKLTEIGSCAFYYCTSLKNIELPDSVTQIGHLAFAGCKSLESVLLSESIEKIDKEAFSGTTRFCNIFVPLSKEEWESSVRVEQDWLGYDDNWQASVFYYTETRPSGSARKYWHYGADGKPELWG